MTTSLPPNPCLVAIILVIRTRAGPKIVYHYPSNPSFSATSSARNPAWYGTSGEFSDQSDTSDSDVSSDSDCAQQGGDSSSRAGSQSSTGRAASRRHGNGSVRSARTRDTGTAFSNEDLDEEMPATDKQHRNHNRDGQRRNGNTGNHESDEPAWENILGFGTDGLGKLLAPARNFNKRRFEFGIDQLVFLGTPRFVREDGLWKKKRRTKRHEQVDQDTPNGKSQTQNTRKESNSSIIEPKSFNSAEFEEVPIYGAAYGHGMSSAPSEVNSESRSESTSGHTSEADLTMFNVVFVMNPPALEYSIRVQEMYDNIVKKFAKALKYAQAFNSYVYQESRAILAMKDKGRENHTQMSILWSSIAQNSSLARAIMVTFNTISNDKIAHVNLGQDFDASFQLPQPVSISGVPTPTEPQMPGLWLTTATPWEDDEQDTLISPHSALLLLEDDAVLLKEVESDAKELSGPLSHFVRNLTPEKSLLKICQKSKLTINDVQLLARHLIYWRRSRAIPPLRDRDIYIVSPNADMHNLKSAIPAFASKYPTLPSLPTILNQLSGTPRPWYTLFPSRDHRATYMRILAWLMRHGWVTQLRTFGWVRVSPAIKASVASKLGAEKLAPSKTSDQTMSIRSSPFIGAADRPSESRSTERNAPNTASRQLLPEENTTSTARPGSTRADSVASDTTSISSGHTAITVVPPFSPLSRPITTLSSPAPPSSSTNPSEPLTSPTLSAIPIHLDSPHDRPSSSSAASVLDPNDTSSTVYTASIIHSPQKATTLELRWIEEIGSSFNTNTSPSPAPQPSISSQMHHQSNKPPQANNNPSNTHTDSTATPAAIAAEKAAAALWPVLLKYFDGKHAFEEIYVREGLKKRRVAAVLAWLGQQGWLVCVKHW